MTLEELKAERARIDKEIEKLSGLNFDVGSARLTHYKHGDLNEFRVKIRFYDGHSGRRSNYSYKEVFRYSEKPSEDYDDNVLGYVDDGIDEIIESLQELRKELHRRWDLQ